MATSFILLSTNEVTNNLTKKMFKPTLITVFFCLRKEPKYITVLLMLLLAALLISNPFYIVLKAVRLSEFYARSYQEHTVYYVKKFFCRKILYSTDAIMSRTLKDIAWRVVATFKCLLIVPKI